MLHYAAADVHGWAHFCDKSVKKKLVSGEQPAFSSVTQQFPANPTSFLTSLFQSGRLSSKRFNHLLQQMEIQLRGSALKMLPESTAC